MEVGFSPVMGDKQAESCGVTRSVYKLSGRDFFRSLLCGQNMPLQKSHIPKRNILCGGDYLPRTKRPPGSLIGRCLQTCECGLHVACCKGRTPIRNGVQVHRRVHMERPTDTLLHECK